MRAIDTRYAGRLFRSRLEARYAVLFDALGIKWDYEPEGFVLDDGSRYLPDFWLPESRTWVDVRPQAPAPFEARRLHWLATELRTDALFLIGPVDRAHVLVLDALAPGHFRNFGNGLADLLSTLRVEGDLPGAVAAALSARFEFGVAQRGVQA